MHLRHRIFRALEGFHQLSRPNSNCSFERNRYCRRDLLKWKFEREIDATGHDFEK
mgnify:CR=1 FL=1